MREILFRGKRLADGEWAEGWLVQDAYCGSEPPEIGEYYGGKFHGEYVISNTVGQFTGLYDRNGARIFEGDIVEFRAYVALSRYPVTLRGVVVFREGAFWALTSPTFDFLYTLAELCSDDAAEDYAVKVVGNVHDNPERLPEYVPELLADSD